MFTQEAHSRTSFVSSAIKVDQFSYMQQINNLKPLFFTICVDYRPIRKKVVIHFSPAEISFNQGNHCRLIAYFRTNSFTKDKYIISCNVSSQHRTQAIFSYARCTASQKDPGYEDGILFEKLTGVCARFSKDD